MGLALAPLRRRAPAEVPWCRELYRSSAPRRERTTAPPVVVDLSALWAGPLCAQLLQMMGAQVIKVESTLRPDGMRQAAAGFYDLLNAGKASVALDFDQPRARAQLRRLLSRADIVIEASRPRALRQLGIVAEEILAENPTATWVGHLRLRTRGAGRELGGFRRRCRGGRRTVAGVVGLHRAGDVLRATRSRIRSPGCTPRSPPGAAFSKAEDGCCHSPCVTWWRMPSGLRHLRTAAASRARARQWSDRVGREDVAAPQARPVQAPARALGADTTQILAGLGGRA